MICANLLNNLEKINIMTQNKFNIFNIIFVVLASIIAALGFLYNSTDAILGSMLISSITNPLFTFVILFLLNQYTNSIYKIFNFGFLFIIAIIISVTIGYINQKYKVFNTPTHEMKTRIKISHVIIDVILALLSGFGLGIALINKDIVSKVGFNIILAVILIIVILLPRSEGGALGLGVSQDNFTSARSVGTFLTKFTSIIATLFIICSIAIVAISRDELRESQSVLEKEEEENSNLPQIPQAK